MAEAYCTHRLCYNFNKLQSRSLISITFIIEQFVCVYGLHSEFMQTSWKVNASKLHWRTNKDLNKVTFISISVFK